MGIRVEGDMEHLKDAVKNLEELQVKALSKQIGMSLKESTRERFSTQEDPQGSPWKTSIRAKTEGGVTLTNTGILKNSIRYKVKGDGVAIGTDVVYAGTHQEGFEGTIKAKTSRGLRFKIGGRWINKKEVSIKIPARPFMGIGEEDIEEVNEIVSAAIERCIT
jgi:phage virion morphogenesis protein